jgi:acyl-CoA synthetase
MTATGRWSLRTTAPDLADRYRDAGLWTDETLGVLIEDRLSTHPDLEVRIWSAARPTRHTFAEVHRLAGRFAAGLAARGIGPGSVVAMQLPNTVEAAVVFWGTALSGAVIVPIVHFYGRHEVDFIVEQAAPELFVTHVDQVAEVLADEPSGGPVAVSPDEPALIAYTSGTTSHPKGVIHTHRTIVAEVHQLGDVQPPGSRPSLTGAPVGHAIGMLAGLLLPPYLHRPVHLIDAWSPPAVLDAMIEGDLSAGSGSTYFLLSLLDDPGLGPEHLERMAEVGLGGSAVPVAIAERAIGLGISVSRAYGSTEHPSITGAGHDEPQERRANTDGRPLSGVEVRIVDEDGHDVAAGTAGEILSRGPELFAGYTDPELTASVMDAEGWYHTGDVGIVDELGWLTITDRLGDLIIRGGENVSPAEVEDLLMRLSGVAEVVVVAAPDPRFGEHGCAFIRLTPGAPPIDLDAIRAHLADAGLAKQKWPEEVRVVEDLPRTPSGKVKRFELRALLRS